MVDPVLDVTHLVQIDTPVSVLSNKLDATAVMGWGGVGMLMFLELAHILDHQHACCHTSCANRHACVCLVKQA